MRMRRTARFLDLPVWLPGLALLSICFLAGMVAGCFWANGIAGEGNEALSAYIDGCLAGARVGELAVPDIFSVLIDILRWPVLTFLLAFTAAGIIGIPFLFLIRSFLLSFAVTSFVRVFGGTGIILAFALFGITGLFTVPVLFVLGTQGLTACFLLASRLRGKKRSGILYGKQYFVRCGVCAAVLLLCVFCERIVIPPLVAMMAGTFQV